MKRSTVARLASYVDALRPIIYVNNFDFNIIDETIATVGKNVKCVEFNNALGVVDFKDKHPLLECDLLPFLKLVLEEGYDQDTFIILKDIHPYLEASYPDAPKVIAYLKRMAENTLYNDDYNCTVFVVSEKLVIPPELENYITIFDLPLPTMPEILTLIKDFVRDLDRGK